MYKCPLLYQVNSSFFGFHILIVGFLAVFLFVLFCFDLLSCHDISASTFKTITVCKSFIQSVCFVIIISSEMLAWASAQIHCQFHASESRVALPAQGNKQDVQAESDTVLIPSRGQWQKESYLVLFVYSNTSELNNLPQIASKCVAFSAGERGQCVLDTPPKILFCDLRLDPGESKTCMCV